MTPDHFYAPDIERDLLSVAFWTTWPKPESKAVFLELDPDIFAVESHRRILASIRRALEASDHASPTLVRDDLRRTAPEALNALPEVVLAGGLTTLTGHFVAKLTELKQARDGWRQTEQQRAKILEALR